MADVGEMLVRVTREAGPSLAAFGFVLTGSQADAEELVQEAIVKVLVRRPRLTEVPAAEQYVRQAMRTLVIDRARKAERFRRYAATNRPADVAPDRVQSISDRVEVERALGALTPKQRVAVALRYWDDMTVTEVAAAMHVRPGTVKRYLHEAAASLRPVLGEHVEEDEPGVRIVDARRPKGGGR